MVYRDGLENRYGLTAIGGSNPSPSAKLIVIKIKIMKGTHGIVDGFQQDS